MITNSSFSDPEMSGGQQVLLFPSFKSIWLPDISTSTVEQFVQGVLLPETLHPMHNALSASQKETLTRVPRSSRPEFLNSSSWLWKPTILICSHNSRDTRCGVMGPLLLSEFEHQLEDQDLRVSTTRIEPAYDGRSPDVQVGLISHIGGHKWAGNVIVYVPPAWLKGSLVMTTDDMKVEANSSPLAGCGIWYGRVEPKHVEGIIKETLLGGKVIKELFRGGIGPNSEILRLPLEKWWRFL
jgi:hypothetical protein